MIGNRFSFVFDVAYCISWKMKMSFIAAEWDSEAKTNGNRWPNAPIRAGKYNENNGRSHVIPTCVFLRLHKNTICNRWTTIYLRLLAVCVSPIGEFANCWSAVSFFVAIGNSIWRVQLRSTFIRMYIVQQIIADLFALAINYNPSCRIQSFLRL